MTRIRRILRDYVESGSVNELLAPWGFVDDEVFLTKAGHVGLVYRVDGVEFEGLPHDRRSHEPNGNGAIQRQTFAATSGGDAAARRRAGPGDRGASAVDRNGVPRKHRRVRNG